ncbi:MAG TPA: hypothetical protein VFL27_00940 [Candidatus Dormibacteraeota bacterium]|nr:hypothetical protein [Candidatus Dormibacteraeota bacterium]
MVSLVVIFAVACGQQTSVTAKPMATFAAVPSQADVRKLMGDDNWYAGPPSFDVSPLNSLSRPATLKYSITVIYAHLGTAEEIAADYSVYDTTSSANTVMSGAQSTYGPTVSSPKVGDQVLYYQFRGGGAAPHIARVFVRISQMVLEVAWANKDAPASVDQLAKVARGFVSRFQTSGKGKPTPLPLPSPLAAKELPPPGLDITLLGSAHLPIESLTVMIGSALPDTLASLLHQSGIDTFAYGDYALNNDTHMEVQTALLTFGSALDATTFAKDFGPGTADSAGIYSDYIPESGSPASGEYHYVFAANNYGIYMICKSSTPGEAASRECETPTHRTAIAWQASLQGIG